MTTNYTNYNSKDAQVTTDPTLALLKARLEAASHFPKAEPVSPLALLKARLEAARHFPTIDSANFVQSPTSTAPASAKAVEPVAKSLKVSNYVQQLRNRKRKLEFLEEMKTAEKPKKSRPSPKISLTQPACTLPPLAPVTVRVSGCSSGIVRATRNITNSSGPSGQKRVDARPWTRAYRVKAAKVHDKEVADKLYRLRQKLNAIQVIAAARAKCFS